MLPIREKKTGHELSLGMFSISLSFFFLQDRRSSLAGNTVLFFHILYVIRYS